MNTATIEILTRPTYETLCRELDRNPAYSGDRGWEGCIGEPPDGRPHVRIIDSTRVPPDDEITDNWGMRPGRYTYDGKDVKMV